MAPSNPDENLLKTMWALDESMLQAHRDGAAKDSEDTARVLLEYAELPLLIRARALMVLGRSDKPGFLDHAKEAVRIAQLGIDTSTKESLSSHIPLTKANTIQKTKLQQELLESCQHVLKEAQEAYDQGEEEEVEEDPALVEQDPEKDLEAADVVGVWEDGKCIIVKDEEANNKAKEAAMTEKIDLGNEEAETTAIDVQVADTMDVDKPEGPQEPQEGAGKSQVELPKGKKIKSRRIDSGYAGDEEKLQHYDKAVDTWVDAGTATDPLFVDENDEDEMLLGYVGDEYERRAT